MFWIIITEQCNLVLMLHTGHSYSVNVWWRKSWQITSGLPNFNNVSRHEINKEANKQEFAKFYLPNVSDRKIVIEFSSIKHSCHKVVYNFIHKSHFSRPIGSFSYAS